MEIEVIIRKTDSGKKSTMIYKDIDTANDMIEDRELVALAEMIKANIITEISEPKIFVEKMGAERK